MLQNISTYQNPDSDTDELRELRTRLIFVLKLQASCVAPASPGPVVVEAAHKHQDP